MGPLKRIYRPSPLHDSPIYDDPNLRRLFNAINGSIWDATICIYDALSYVMDGKRLSNIDTDPRHVSFFMSKQIS
jgi:hypothetical protein